MIRCPLTRFWQDRPPFVLELVVIAALLVVIMLEGALT